MPKYDTLTKRTHRHVVVALWQERPHLPLLYLDDGSGAATAHFLTAGVPASLLRPVNWDATACAAIRRATGVRAAHADIRTLVETAPERYGVAWLDLECKTIPDPLLARTLSVAPLAMLTLSTRACAVEDVRLDLAARVRGLGGRVLDAGPYEGRSGRTSMFRAVLCGRPRGTKKKRLAVPSSRRPVGLDLKPGRRAPFLRPLLPLRRGGRVSPTRRRG